MSSADFSRTCEGCGHVVEEPGPKDDDVWFRCFAPGPCRGRVVGLHGRFDPWIPAWCPLMKEENRGTPKH